LTADWGLTSQDVAASGDMPNDVPMIRWAGWGMAVRSAHAELLAVADEVIGDPDEDGVGMALNRMNRRP
jgi:hydroxymethylpyrimidine pyrophosphatase-like HAD family hydrolase